MQRQQQRRIIDKVWGMVEKIIADMKAGLLAQLADPARSVDAQEKTIEYVLDQLDQTFAEPEYRR